MLFKFCFEEQWIWKCGHRLCWRRVVTDMHSPCTHGNWNAWTFRHGIRLGPKRVETEILKFLSPVMILSCWAQRNCIELHRPCSHGKLTKQLFGVAGARARLRSSLEPKWLRKHITIIVCKYNTSYMHLQHKRKTVRSHTGCQSVRTHSLGPTWFLAGGNSQGLTKRLTCTHVCAGVLVIPKSKNTIQ